MPSTWANLLFPKPNSDVVPISMTVVFAIIADFSPIPNFFVADNFAFLRFQKSI